MKVGINSGKDIKSDKDPVNLLELIEEQVSGYNSGDEHLGSKEQNLTDEEWKLRDEKFSKSLSERGLIIKEMEEDGACLFRAISFQMYGDQEMHDIIRQQTMDYIYQNREYFAEFITEDITKYVSRKRQNHLHGNHIEIQAMSEMYNRPVELYCYELTPINIYNSQQINNGYEPLRLSYHRYSHYNAILDPYKSSVGVGLGLAGYQPEQFDPMKQVNDAVQMSEQLEIEKMMVEDKLKTTDWEATSDVVVEQIARQSYLQFCKENMNKSLKKSSNNSTSTVTSTEACGSSSSAMSSGDVTPPGCTQQQGCSSNKCDTEASPNSYLMEYYMHTQVNGRRKKSRHLHGGYIHVFFSFPFLIVTMILLFLEIKGNLTNSRKSSRVQNALNDCLRHQNHKALRQPPLYQVVTATVKNQYLLFINPYSNHLIRLMVKIKNNF